MSSDLATTLQKARSQLAGPWRRRARGPRQYQDFGAARAAWSCQAEGGLRATFRASPIYTAIVFIGLVIRVYTVYVKNSSTYIIYDSLQTVSSYTTEHHQCIFSATA